MAKSGYKKSIRVEWFNVTYRSVYSILTVIVLAALTAGGSWYYFYQYRPRAGAAAAIQEADEIYRQAATFRDRPGLVEALERSQTALDAARLSYMAGAFDDAQVRAFRSRDLSRQALDMARGREANAHVVRFFRIEGDVRVKKAGEFSWGSASQQMELGIGDQIKTSSSASAQVIYFDGTVTTIQSGSLLEIRELYEDPVTRVRRVREKLSWGELEASTQRRNVNGSYHEVTTANATARADEAGEFRVAYDKETKTAEFDVFRGKIAVSSAKRRESVTAGERVRTNSTGRLTGKEALPGVPRPVAPADQRVFVFNDNGTVTLRWQELAGHQKYHLVISERVLFTDPLYDALREGTTALLDGVAPGLYYWKVAAISRSGAQGPFSEPRAFRVSSEKIQDREDTVPPELEITDFVLIGTLVIANGRTEPGSSLWADNERLDVDDNGTFYAVIRMRKEGTNGVEFVAQDNAGNETRVTRSAYVELY